MERNGLSPDSLKKLGPGSRADRKERLAAEIEPSGGFITCAMRVEKELFVPPPLPVYSPGMGPPNVKISSAMFVHSTASAPMQYWPVEAVHGCSESWRVAADGPARARRVADECMELLSNH